MSDEAMKGFAFLRTAHLPLLNPQGAAPTITGEVEVTQFLERLTGYLLKKLLPHGGEVLLLGSHIPGWTAELPTATTVWRFRDSEEWLKNGFPPETSHLVRLNDNASFSRPVADFDVIISSTWLHEVFTPEALPQLANYLTRHTRPGGINLHAFTAVLHPDYFWTYPALAHLRTHWNLKD